MLAVLHKIMSVTDPEQLYRLDDALFEDFPLCIFWKNKDSIYQGGNDYLAKTVGLHIGTDLKGCSDFELSWARSAEDFRLNDKQVMQNDSPRITIETGHLALGGEARAISCKMPLRLRSKRVAGVLGVAITLGKDDFLPGFLPNNCNMETRFAVEYGLTRRQKECVYYLSKGMSIKQIARVLALSPRTVEHYLEAVREKAGCHSSAELITKMMTEENLITTSNP